VQDAERIKRVAERIVRARKEGHDVVVVASAMGDTTDELIDLAEQVSPAPPPRELDMLLTAGERISNALLAMAIHALGAEARSFTGSQAGMITTSKHGDARIVEVNPGRLKSALAEGAVVLVAGFQGMSGDSKEITTLGRGGSDTTAVALAAAMQADVCEIYTDVDGVYTADPRIVSKARHLDSVCYEEMLELAACGAKVLHLRAVEYARRYNVPLRVRSSYNDKPGTLVSGSMEDIPVEQAIITGVAHDRSEGKVTVTGVPDSPGHAARIFRAVADAEINIDMVLQNISHASERSASGTSISAERSASGTSISTDRRTDITFTLPRSHGPTAVAALERAKAEIGFDEVFYDGNVGKVSLVGAGMRSHPGVTATFCESLSRAGINIETMNTSEIRISVLCREDQLNDAVRALHEAFELGGEEEAVVHAGTGR
jgi:aspartate kinase